MRAMVSPRRFCARPRCASCIRSLSIRSPGMSRMAVDRPSTASSHWRFWMLWRAAALVRATSASWARSSAATVMRSSESCHFRSLRNAAAAETALAMLESRRAPSRAASIRSSSRTRVGSRSNASRSLVSRSLAARKEVETSRSRASAIAASTARRLRSACQRPLNACRKACSLVSPGKRSRPLSTITSAGSHSPASAARPASVTHCAMAACFSASLRACRMRASSLFSSIWFSWTVSNSRT